MQGSEIGSDYQPTYTTPTYQSASYALPDASPVSSEVPWTGETSPADTSPRQTASGDDMSASSGDSVSISDPLAPGKYDPSSFTLESFDLGRFDLGSTWGTSWTDGEPASADACGTVPATDTPEISDAPGATGTTNDPIASTGFDLGDHAPGTNAPGILTPGTLDPAAFDPAAFDPGNFDAGDVGPGDFDPGNFEQGDFDPGNFDAGSRAASHGVSGAGEQDAAVDPSPTVTPSFASNPDAEQSAPRPAATGPQAASIDGLHHLAGNLDALDAPQRRTPAPAPATPSRVSTVPATPFMPERDRRADFSVRRRRSRRWARFRQWTFAVVVAVVALAWVEHTERSSTVPDTGQTVAASDSAAGQPTMSPSASGTPVVNPTDTSSQYPPNVAVAGTVTLEPQTWGCGANAEGLPFHHSALPDSSQWCVVRGTVRENQTHPRHTAGARLMPRDIILSDGMHQFLADPITSSAVPGTPLTSAVPAGRAEPLIVWFQVPKTAHPFELSFSYDGVDSDPVELP